MNRTLRADCCVLMSGPPGHTQMKTSKQILAGTGLEVLYFIRLGPFLRSGHSTALWAGWRESRLASHGFGGWSRGQVPADSVLGESLPPGSQTFSLCPYMVETKLRRLPLLLRGPTLMTSSKAIPLGRGLHHVHLGVSHSVRSTGPRAFCVRVWWVCKPGSGHTCTWSLATLTPFPSTGPLP